MRLPPLSFRAQLTLEWTMGFGLLLALALVAVYAGARRTSYRDLEAQVRTLAATELASAVDEYRGVHLHDFPAGAIRQQEYADKFVQLYGQDGRVLMQTPGLGRTGPLLAGSDFARALSGTAPVVAVVVDRRPGRMAALVTEKDGARYVVAVGLFADRLEGNLGRLGRLLAGVWVVTLLATGVLGYALATRALHPIGRITERAATIARGQGQARLDPPVRNDEIGRMTTLLNEMLARLNGVIDANRRFASDASHELRSPLTAMAGEVDVALKRDRSAIEYRETLGIVREGLDEMTRLTENLILLARAQEQPQGTGLYEVNLQPLVEAAVRRVADLAEVRGIRFGFECPGLIAYGDERLLGRAVDNLIANAVQYNRDGGSVVVSGEIEEAAGDAWAPGHVILRVSDTGPGIPPDEWERVFDRFHRLEPSRSRRTGGSGLGLAICRAVAATFGGSIRVAASSDCGTTMELRLPGRAAGTAAV